MAFHEPNACTVCGELGQHQTADCPQNYCTNCHRHGHKFRKCPHIECFRCQAKGHTSGFCSNIFCTRCSQTSHQKNQCPLNKPENRGATLIAIPSNKRRRLVEESFPVSQDLRKPEETPGNSTMQALTEHHEFASNSTKIQSLDRTKLVPRNVSENSMHENCLSVEHNVIFPNLEKLTTQLVEGVWSEMWQRLLPLPYYGMIEMYGGKTALIQTILESIPNEVSALEGKQVTVRELDLVRDRQGPFEAWPAHSGYLDYVTDDRNPEYWRPYVGQASDTDVRIHQHLTASEKNRRNTLHYYLVSEGGEFRHMNYIRLWSLPDMLAIDENATDSRLLINNILETVMCCAFQSLPRQELEEFIGKKYFKFQSTGLNILPPFFQGISLDIQARAKYVNNCASSSDEQIQRWPIERRRQLDNSKKSLRAWGEFQPYWRRTDYENAFFTAMMSVEDCKHLADSVSMAEHRNNPAKIDIRFLLEQVASSLTQDGNKIKLVRPHGSLAARVGVVLGPCPVNKDVNDAHIQDNVTAIPSALLDAAFTETNSLIWSFNLQQCFQARPNTNRVTLSEKYKEALSGFHRSIINASNLKVILLCGRDAGAVVLKPHITANETTIALRGCTFNAYLETDEARTMVKRIYIRLVASLAIMSRCENWEEIKEHAEVFRFASVITKTSSIRGFSIATQLISKEIILRYWAEREGLYEPMTIASMDPKIREWLVLKGITSDEQIESFERLGGSLMRGVSLLLFTLPKYPFQQPERKGPVLRQDVQPRIEQRVFDVKTVKKCRELYARFTGIKYNTHIKAMDIPGEAQTLQVKSKEAPDRGNSNEGSTDAWESWNAIENVEKHDDLLTSDELYEIYNASRKPRENIMDQDSDVTLEHGGFQYAPKFRNALVDRDTQERKYLLQGKWFEGHVYQHLGNHYQIWALNNMLTVRFSYDNVRLKEGFILQVQLSPPGIRHPSVYAFHAQDNDPASRMAVKITGTLNNGQQFTIYAHQPPKAWKEPMRVNAVFDWFCGASLEDIALANVPRRYIYISEKDYFSNNGYGPGLLKFVKGGFTDSSLSEEEQHIWQFEMERKKRS